MPPRSTAQRVPAQTNSEIDQLTLFFTPEDMHRTWLSAIKGAKKSIFMEMFHLTDRKIVNALRAKAVDVEIRLILDSGNLLDAGTKKIADALVNGHQNITIYPSSPAPGGFKQTHTKAMIVDDDLALVTSINLTNNAPIQRDYGIATHDSNIIAEMNAVFTADMQNSQNAKTGQQPLQFTPEGVGLGKLIWSNVGSETRLVDLINEAKEIPAGPNRFLYATVENIGDPAIQEALSGAAESGVVVRLIVPQCVLGINATRNYDFFSDLKFGVEVRVMPHPSSATQPYMHGKMMVLGNGHAYVGSVNYSTSSTRFNRELGIIFTNPQLALGAPGDGSVIDAYKPSLKSIFESDWEQAVAVANPNEKPDCPTTTTSPAQ